jgi:hypothetical protein
MAETKKSAKKDKKKDLKQEVKAEPVKQAVAEPVEVKAEPVKQDVVEPVEVKAEPVKQEKPPVKSVANVSKRPKFVLKEKLLFKGEECVFVEKLRGKVIARKSSGGYVSGQESEFTC